MSGVVMGGVELSIGADESTVRLRRVQESGVDQFIVGYSVNV